MYVFISGDSQLILKQVEGIYKVKNENLKIQHAAAIKLLKSISNYSFEYIPRANNGRADQLANLAMDLKENYSLPLSNLQVSNFIGNGDVDFNDERVDSKVDVTHVNGSITLNKELWTLQFDGGSRGKKSK